MSVSVSTGSESTSPPEQRPPEEQPAEERDSPAEKRRSRAPGPPDAFEESAWLGRVIDDRYRVERLLGEGGMGAVFLAEHVKLQKKVALKIILPQFAGNGEVAERFAREAMASAKLEHPHVASALDYGTLSEGGAYLVMQYARGPSLRSSLSSPRDWRYACDVGAQIADALAAAHAAGIVHRDLKPENVVLEPRDGDTELVRVLDFGIARVLDPAEASGTVSKLTRVGTIIGTPGYMAPEQALGEQVDARADLYALGVILWETVAGHELFTETEVTALVTKQLTTDAPRLASIQSDVPIELDDVVARLLSRDRNDRPEKATEVRDILKRVAFAANMERMSQSGIGWTAPGGPPSQPRIPLASITGPHASLPGLPHAATITGAHAASTTGAHGPISGSHRTGSSVRALSTLFVPGQPLLENRRLVIGAGALGLLAVLFGSMLFMFCSGETPVAEVEGGVPTVTPQIPPPPRPGVPTTVTPPRTIPTGVEPPPVADAAELTPIPTTVSSEFETILHDEGRGARHAAAARLLAMPEGAMPPVVRLVAAFEEEGSCTSRRDILDSIVELHDPRALPALERVAHSPRRGCGFLGQQDCYRCLRGPLRRALEDAE